MRPGSSWARVATITVNDRGRVSWKWVTADDDVLANGSWSFRYLVVGRGRSDVVRVRIVAPDS